jgi:hypothetical protein
MARRAARSADALETYWELTKRPLLNLWFILPPLLFFHVGTFFQPTASRAPNDVLRFLQWFGAASWLLPPLLLMTVLAFQAYMRRDRLEFRPRVLLLMLAEAVVWTAPFLLLAQFRARGPAVDATDLFAKALDSVGAAVYEEFLFRMVFISAILAFFVDLLKWRREIFVCLGVVLGAVLFGLYHFSPVTPEPFRGPDFMFLMAAGLLWGIAYLTRGFGIAVGAHVAWNLYLLVRLPV